MDITIDQDRCIGAGQCALIAPAVFDQRDEDGLAVLLTDRPGSDQHTAVREAAESCPLSAISVREDPEPAA
ncbi:ferredoxin [Streptomyces sp. ALI-76-A]|jgi:ferredoxin|uniref:ferredoxin n=1 Tax=Streptomyces sp. ALI-76-A TaxID=3025736 RepID=UPI00256F4447|nr:ferredoxin [Streptomyces sp. ALI-76-A]MDL5205951.1 ferredoxin [Streptomyces sp. ALI-76-A]